jgi:SAM-dependent methyltransferase
VARSSRKEAKYLTHGLHPFKGKFYPQLAKSLLNATGLREGDQVLDPFCGSGTTLLEGRLNGLRTAGCDLNPLAAQIARVKLALLDSDPREVTDAVSRVEKALARIPNTLSAGVDQFANTCVEEIQNWFPAPVVSKLNFLLGRIRREPNSTIREFLEVVLSSVLREVSHQDPADLRIRRRKDPLRDADVTGIFAAQLRRQYTRLERFWSIRGYKPAHLLPAIVRHGDARDHATYTGLGLAPDSVDVVLTSPPYAMALPYIDTDRLSLLVLFGMPAGQRRPLEHGLTGSREILGSLRSSIEARISQNSALWLPSEVCDFIRALARDSEGEDVGFRRRNMPALLVRFFEDMAKVIESCVMLLRPGGHLLMVIGDSRTEVRGVSRLIPTTRFVEALAITAGLEVRERLSIDVTTENLRHIRHAITRNTVLWFKRRLG